MSSPSDSKSVIQPPKDYDGRDMEQARLFISTFQVWAQSQPKKFQLCDASGQLVYDTNGKPVWNHATWIPALMSFLKSGPAAE